MVVQCYGFYFEIMPLRPSAGLAGAPRARLKEKREKKLPILGQLVVIIIIAKFEYSSIIALLNNVITFSLAFRKYNLCMGILLDMP
jgi:hypothetical protein